MFSAIKRRLFKGAVVNEFHRLYGVNLRAIGDIIGSGTLDDILNVQYEDCQGSATRAAKAAHEVIEESIGINVNHLRLRALADQGR